MTDTDVCYSLNDQDYYDEIEQLYIDDFEVGEVLEVDTCKSIPYDPLNQDFAQMIVDQIVVNEMSYYLSDPDVWHVIEKPKDKTLRVSVDDGQSWQSAGPNSSISTDQLVRNILISETNKSQFTLNKDEISITAQDGELVYGKVHCVDAECVSFTADNVLLDKNNLDDWLYAVRQAVLEVLG